MRRVLALFLLFTFLMPGVGILADYNDGIPVDDPPLQVTTGDPQKDREIRFQNLRTSFWSHYGENAEVRDYLSAVRDFAKKYRFGPGGYDPASPLFYRDLASSVLWTAFWSEFDPAFAFIQDYGCPSGEQELQKLSHTDPGKFDLCTRQLAMRKRYETAREEAFSVSRRLDEIEEKRRRIRDAEFVLDDGVYARRASVVPVLPADVAKAANDPRGWIFPATVVVEFGGKRAYAAEADGDGIATKEAKKHYADQSIIGFIERQVVDFLLSGVRSFRAFFGIPDLMDLVFRPDQIYGDRPSEFGTFPGQVYQQILALHDILRKYFLIPVVIAIILYGVLLIVRSGSPEGLLQVKEGLLAAFGVTVLLYFGDIVWRTVFHIVDLLTSSIWYGMKEMNLVEDGMTFERILFGRDGLDGFTQIAPGWMVLLVALVYVFIGAVLTYQYVMRMFYLGVLIVLFPFAVVLGLFPGSKGQFRVWLAEFIGHASLPFAHAIAIFFFLALWHSMQGGMSTLVVLIYLFSLSQVANVIRRVAIPQMAGGHETYQASGGIAGIAASSFMIFSALRGRAMGAGARAAGSAAGRAGENAAGRAGAMRFPVGGAAPAGAGKAGVFAAREKDAAQGDRFAEYQAKADLMPAPSAPGPAAPPGDIPASGSAPAGDAPGGRTVIDAPPVREPNPRLRGAGRALLSFGKKAAGALVRGAVITSAASSAMVMQGLTTGQINFSTGLAAGAVASELYDRAAPYVSSAAGYAARQAVSGYRRVQNWWQNRPVRAKMIYDPSTWRDWPGPVITVTPSDAGDGSAGSGKTVITVLPSGAGDGSAGNGKPALRPFPPPAELPPPPEMPPPASGGHASSGPVPPPPAPGVRVPPPPPPGKTPPPGQVPPPPQASDGKPKPPPAGGQVPSPPPPPPKGGDSK
ncbi:MAG: hypothetical protein HSCHL_0978 [Hydrogenibacillus schlegelii]|uniref:Uncharacterized protein n=1 Tax=Hydrogenibacillus schlegelii TaxID=1484 RepID=A0A2T5G6W1_HYDSH|nr:hypothetical protein [Hydrogenibacillus schlegelii]PTQ51902.1 MAG: hypothetical protein HSCHL_0978 [Hydrogenibacillus schlegelii]